MFKSSTFYILIQTYLEIMGNSETERIRLIYALDFTSASKNKNKNFVQQEMMRYNNKLL